MNRRRLARKSLRPLSFETFLRHYPQFVAEHEAIVCAGFTPQRVVGRSRLRDGSISFLRAYRNDSAGTVMHLLARNRIEVENR